MRYIIAVALFVISVASANAESLRAPLEKQFFDYFAKQCSDGLAAEATSMNMDPSQPAVAEGINRYCSCTSQAVVSRLDAGEIIAFANDPSKEPAASKMKPYFAQCHGK